MGGHPEQQQPKQKETAKDAEIGSIKSDGPRGLQPIQNRQDQAIYREAVKPKQAPNTLGLGGHETIISAVSRARKEYYFKEYEDKRRWAMGMPSFEKAVKSTVSNIRQQMRKDVKIPENNTADSRNSGDWVNPVDPDISKEVYSAYAVSGEKGIDDLVSHVNQTMSKRGEFADQRGTLKVEMINEDGTLRPLNKNHDWTNANGNPPDSYRISLFNSAGKLIALEKINPQKGLAISGTELAENLNDQNQQRLDTLSDRNYVVDQIIKFEKEGHWPGTEDPAAKAVSAKFDKAVDRDDLYQFLSDVNTQLGARQTGISLKLVDLHDRKSLGNKYDELGRKMAQLVAQKYRDPDKYIEEISKSLKSYNKEHPGAKIPESVNRKEALREARSASRAAGLHHDFDPVGGFDVSYWEDGFYNIHHPGRR